VEIFNQPKEFLLDQHNIFAEKFTKLENGQTIDHPWYLTGGGDWMYPSFIDSIQRAGKEKYNVVFEWCFGHGRIGWELLTKNFCRQLVFNDCYDLAVTIGAKNAEKLGYKHAVRGYHTPTISAIPIAEKFDLVIGNPPHIFDKDHIYKMYKNRPQEMIDLACRTTVDQDWKIHEDFFKYIGNYLTDDADIFINNHSTMKRYTEKMAAEYGFQLINNFEKNTAGQDQFPILHFKKLDSM